MPLPRTPEYQSGKLEFSDLEAGGSPYPEELPTMKPEHLLIVIVWQQQAQEKHGRLCRQP